MHSWWSTLLSAKVPIISRSKWQISGFLIASSWNTQLSASITGALSAGSAVRAL